MTPQYHIEGSFVTPEWRTVDDFVTLNLFFFVDHEQILLNIFWDMHCFFFLCTSREVRYIWDWLLDEYMRFNHDVDGVWYTFWEDAS